MPHVLLVDDDPETLAWLSEFVKAEGFTVATADSLRAARIQLTRLAPDILITDLILPDGQGIELVNDLESRDATEFVVMTGYASTESAIDALRAGATDYLVKPADIERLKAILRRVPRPEELREQIGELRQELRKLGRFGHILGSSPSIQKLYDQLSRVAPTSATVLLVGRERHRQGARRADDPRAEPPQARAVPAAQLRRDVAAADRERALRPREGQLHRRRPAAQGLLRARPRRHVVPGRDHRDAARAAGEAAARAGDGHVHAGRHEHADRDATSA